MLREDEHAYRERMEAFVSGLTGTTMAELVLVSMPIPMGIWLLGETKVRCPDSKNRVRHACHKYDQNTRLCTMYIASAQTRTLDDTPIRVLRTYNRRC